MRFLALFLAVCSLSPVLAQQRLDEMSLDRWAKLRETERYQLQIAEKYYREKNWKVALSEYEKYLTLYEQSEAAPYAQLKWSLSQVMLRKANTAIKDGFQSVIDYWPDSADSVAASYYIGKTYKDIGQLSKAKKAYSQLVSQSSKHLAAVYAMADMIEIAGIEKNEKMRVDLWRKLTFDIPRSKYAASHCSNASRQLAAHYFSLAAFDQGVQALATTYKPQAALTPQVTSHLATPLSRLIADSKTQAQGEKLADLAIAYLKENTPTDLGEEAAKQQAVQIWFSIADLHHRARRPNQVVETFETMLKRFGKDDAILAKLAQWRIGQGQFDLAREVYRRYENKIEGNSQIALSYRRQKKHDSAVAIYQQLIGLDPENVLRWKAEIAAAYREVPKYKEAIAFYTQLMQEDIEQADRWRWQIATAYKDAGQHKEAIGFFRQCVNFPENYKQMARCHRHLKQHNEALLLYNQIAGGHETSAPWALLQAAYTREEANQKEAAIRGFQLLCKRYPKSSYASTAHAHLQNKYKLSITLGGAKDED